MSLQTIRTARIKEDDGTITDNVPLGAFGIHIKMANGKNLEDTLKEYVHKNMDVGKGLIYETWEEESLVPTQAPDLIRAYIGQGLKYEDNPKKVSQTHFMLNLSDGLKFKDNTENSKVTLRTGRGLHFYGDKTDEKSLETYLAEGLTFNGLGAIIADLGNGLEFNSQGQIKIKIDDRSNPALGLSAGGLKLTVEQNINDNAYPVSGTAVKNYCKDYVTNITSNDQSVAVTRTTSTKGISFDLSVQGGGPAPETGVTSVTGVYPVVANPTTGAVTISLKPEGSLGVPDVVQDKWYEIKNFKQESSPFNYCWSDILESDYSVNDLPDKFDNSGKDVYIDLVEFTNGGNITKEGYIMNGMTSCTIDTSKGIGKKEHEGKVNVYIYSMAMGSNTVLAGALHFWTLHYKNQ